MNEDSAGDETIDEDMRSVRARVRGCAGALVRERA